LSLEIFCRGGWVFKSLADRQLNTRARSHARKIFAGDENRGSCVNSCNEMKGSSPMTRTPIGETAMTSTERQPDAQKIFAGDETGGEWVKTGRKPSKIAGLITANSTQKSMSNARKSMSNAR
jgi:hypothetical protein